MNASRGKSMLAWVERLDKAMNAANMNSITPAKIKLHLMIAKNPDNKFREKLLQMKETDTDINYIKELARDWTMVHDISETLGSDKLKRTVAIN